MEKDHFSRNENTKNLYGDKLLDVDSKKHDNMYHNMNQEIYCNMYNNVLNTDKSKIKVMNKIDSQPKTNEMIKVFIEIHHHILEDEYPSNYLNDLSQRKIMQKTPFSMLLKLKETAQSPIHHPEGDVWNHTMLVVDEAAKRRKYSKNPKVFMWAALLHDIGKAETTKVRKNKITAYNHDRIGAVLGKEFLEYFTEDVKFIESVENLIKYHMHILYILKDLPFGKIKDLKKEVDINEIALIGLCDRLGRLNMDTKKEEENIRLFLDKVKRHN